jgi:hypothetical protein
VAVTITTNVEEPRALVAVLVANTGPGSVTVTVERSEGVAGVTQIRRIKDWVLPAGQSVAAVDPEAPLGVSFVYRVLNATTGAVLATSGAVLLDGPWSVDGVASYAFLRHMVDASLSVPVVIKTLPSVDRDGVVDLFTPLGGSKAVAVTQPRQGRAGSLELTSLSDAHTDAIVDLLADGSVIQLAAMPRFGLKGGGLYMAVTAANEARFNEDIGEDETRVITLDFVETVAPPADGAAATAYTWLDLINDNANWTAVGAAYGSWGDLVLSMGP